MTENQVKGRIASLSRQTRETFVQVELNLDGTGEYQIQTGIGFLDHMLAQLAFHGLFDLRIRAEGDYEVDYHHTVEDCGLLLGEAFDRALGERKGLVRMAVQYAPMDDSLARVVVDLSGRPYSVIKARWEASEVGRIPVSLWEHFLESFALRSRSNLHVKVFYGRDGHHQVEAVFKALARSLCEASRLEPRRLNEVPSTKGALNV
ncbi:imidazoleglycerol-phosphate dehydratase [Bellilinea caldifistulae]|uniref:Imidazoleglycerol-phosphate dehydratase n=1 Tax=Bellilinea caldifistulae TaxID=360411 RepID=A0A0P6XYN9_9CHLR|nr:imidazoleglycerol-phosphate dehydratase HisB [Bellilinea caldifistulae]KPL74224.1 imidazoleglycerol-phosphate dehydratase [Bellilinea caldifistulae]GAP10419.1 imidazoleglycerol-phosphate dehydratase [Bellilinea caldifistulae]